MTDSHEEQYKPDRRQLSFDFDEALKKNVKLRYKRRVWVEQIILGGRNELRMKFLLRIIEGHDRDNIGCKLKIETIAKEMGCIRTVKRAIKDCVAAGLLYYEGNRSPLAASFFAIRFDTVAQKIVDHPETIHLIAPREGRFTSDTCAISQVTDVEVTGDTCDGSQVTLVESTSDTCAGSEADPDHILRARVLKPRLNPEVKPSMNPGFPEELDSQEFLEAWNKWVQHREELGKPLTSVASAQQLTDLAALGLTRALAAVEHSLKNSWVNIYEPKSGRGESVSQPGPGQKYDPNAVVGGF